MKKFIFILLVTSSKAFASEYFCGRYYSEEANYYPNGNPTQAKVQILAYDVFDKELEIELLNNYQDEGLKRKCQVSFLHSSNYEYYTCEDNLDFSIPRLVAVIRLKKDQFNRYKKSFNFDFHDATKDYNNLGARIIENSKRSFFCKNINQ